ncbi:carboxymuconolactone decarboxylase family protein [Rhodobium gokarnense]|uniref:AhpD family alkylhydroperoxidase n=1 Tax=Rhodobium gokarnense TaxID=364296 RepID=A0ABT3HAX7_9HYPH|nr:carboxymuconolactone decarboxylase family protein [Rhodobium gokarnense]MCW2307552.1 AhpD family alkylhydroperoxidase [Rhodobium gokarnense]
MPNNDDSMTYDAFRTSQTAAHDALIALGKAVDDGGLEKELTELVKLRVSQMNGCAFCVQLHLNIARKLAVDEAKLGLVSAWRDAGVFSPREKAALKWAERLTRLSGEEPCETETAGLGAHFDDQETVLLTITIGTINAWNRIARGLRFPPPGQ